MKQEIYETTEPVNVHKSGSNLAGGFFILMGIIFFLGMSEVTILGKSAWHLVALLPVYWIVVTAYRRYEQEGHVSGRVLSILAFGLLPFAYIVGPALGISVGDIWPIGFIVTGVVILLGINN